MKVFVSVFVVLISLQLFNAFVYSLAIEQSCSTKYESELINGTKLKCSVIGEKNENPNPP
jgi:hypothetical protein